MSVVDKSISCEQKGSQTTLAIHDTPNQATKLSSRNNTTLVVMHIHVHYKSTPTVCNSS